MHCSTGDFSLNNQTGVIYTAKPLDFENNNSYILRVEADSMRVISSNLRAPAKSESSTTSVSPASIILLKSEGCSSNP